MPCELCGKESGGFRKAVVDGVEMMLCTSCIRHGEGVKETERTPEAVQRFVQKKVKKISEKDIYKGMKKELVSNWNDVIKEAREKKGITREDLGFKIGERTVTISKIENGDLRPSDKTIEKLEKELGIILFEEVKDVTTSSIHSSTSLTLGDFIKTEK